MKIIRDAKYGEILGAHIVGAHATEMIHELVVARENEFTVEEIDLAIHAHPTLSRGDRRGGAGLDGEDDSRLTASCGHAGNAGHVDTVVARSADADSPAVPQPGVDHPC